RPVTRTTTVITTPRNGEPLRQADVSVKSIEGVIGQTVMLPCSVTQKSVNVVWRYRDNRPVCDIIDGKADYDEQDPAYKGRVSLFSSEIDKGNFSIMLSNVVESDAGTYTCTSPGLHREKIELTVTVLVQSVECVVEQTAVLPCSVEQTPQYELWRDKHSKTACDYGAVPRNSESPSRADGLLAFLMNRIQPVETGYFISFIFLILLHKVSVQSSTKHVEGVEGDTVVLPCVYSSGLQKVYWRYKDITVVCDINNGAISDVQDAAYKGRVEIFPSEIQEGNFPVRLKNLTEADVGTYTCSSPNRFKLYVQLNVT
ncbi:antigen like protein, partial [Clarias magur]